MELRHLRYFVVAAEEEHFHRAADRLHIVQPALSRQIRLLEEELGTSLFDRHSQGVKLSQAGQVFREGAEKILAEVDWLAERTRRAGQGRTGILKIGTNCIGMRSPYPPASIGLFRKQFPETELKLHVEKSQAQLDAIYSGAIDAGFMFDRPVGDSELSHVFVQDNNRCLLLPRGHRLVNAAKIELADLKDEPFIFMPRTHHPMAYDRLMAACVAGNLSPRVVQEANDENAILHLVSAGLGVSFLISPFWESLPEGVVVREVLDLSVPVKLELVWKRSNTSAVLKRFIETVEVVIAEGNCERAPSPRTLPKRSQLSLAVG